MEKIIKIFIRELKMRTIPHPDLAGFPLNFNSFLKMKQSKKIEKTYRKIGELVGKWAVVNKVGYSITREVYGYTLMYFTYIGERRIGEQRSLSDVFCENVREDITEKVIEDLQRSFLIDINNEQQEQLSKFISKGK